MVDDMSLSERPKRPKVPRRTGMVTFGRDKPPVRFRLVRHARGLYVLMVATPDGWLSVGYPSNVRMACEILRERYPDSEKVRWYNEPTQMDLIREPAPVQGKLPALDEA